MTETLWEGEPTTVSVRPWDSLVAFDADKLRQLKEDYMKPNGKRIKIISPEVTEEYNRRYEETKIVNIKDFENSIEILTKNGRYKIADFWLRGVEWNSQKRLEDHNTT